MRRAFLTLLALLAVPAMASAQSSVDEGWRRMQEADFEGAVADKYEQIQFGMSRLAVDACNANGWVIPFTQITLHMAGGQAQGADAPTAISMLD